MPSDILEWGQKGFVYSQQGICPTIPASTWKDPIKFVYETGTNMNEDKKEQVTTTRMSDIASTIRASIYKQGERNINEKY